MDGIILFVWSICRLQSDTHSLVEQLDEKTKLNQTLKLELSVHERLQDEGSGV